MKRFVGFVLVITIGLILGCDKYHAKKLAGIYYCKVEYHYWDMTPVNIDSTYYENLEIKQDGKNLMVLGTSIHVDSLWKTTEYYEGYIHNYLKVLFKNDSVYITKSGGGLGGNSSLIYTGIKE